MKLKASLVAFALGLALQTGYSNILVHSTFEDSQLGAVGRQEVVTSNHSNLTPWYVFNSTGTGRMDVVNDVGVLDDQDQVVIPGVGKSAQLMRTYGALTQFDSVDLLDGESLQLTLTYRQAGDVTSGEQGLRIMLFSAPADFSISADSALTSEQTQEFSGYYQGLGISTPGAGSRLRRRSTGNTSDLFSETGTVIGSLNKTGFNSGKNAHQLTLTWTRNGDAMQVMANVDGTTLLNLTDSAGVFSFDTLAIYNSVNNGNIYLTDIQLAYQAIPEPGTAAILIGGSLVLLLGRFRRRRKANSQPEQTKTSL